MKALALHVRALGVNRLAKLVLSGVEYGARSLSQKQVGRRVLPGDMVLSAAACCHKF